ncbi:hypothetical protein [Flagellimonas sp.]|uniref:hypothetical protein n=1 Tax=Flagellimonas sp. TaxID=2058762 RepID=UPI003F49B9A4
MKKIFLIVVAFLVILPFANAQEENKFRIGLDLGYVIPDAGEGVLVALESKYNIGSNMNIGFRIENSLAVKDVNFTNSIVETDLTSSLSFLGTFDQYFNNKGSIFSPFMGIGVGYISLADVGFEFAGNDTIPDAKTTGKFGGLIRAGFELGKLRFTASYNLIGESQVQDEGETAEIKNSYFGISIGFYVGGGKWKK